MAKVKKINMVSADNPSPTPIRIKGNIYTYEAVGLLAGTNSSNYHLTERGIPIIGQIDGDVMLVLRRKAKA